MLSCVLIFSAHAADTDWLDLPEALRRAAREKTPVLVFIEQPADIACIDARHWLTADKSLRALLQKFQRVRMDSGAAGLLLYPAAPSTGFLLLTDQGEPLAAQEVPPLRAEFRALLEQALKFPLSMTALAAQAREKSAPTELVLRAIEVLRRSGDADEASQIWQARRNAHPLLNDALGIKLEIEARFSRADKMNALTRPLVSLQKLNKLEALQQQALYAGFRQAKALLKADDKDDEALRKSLTDTEAALDKYKAAPKDDTLKDLKDAAAKLLEAAGPRGVKLAGEAREFAQAMADAHPNIATAKLYALRGLIQQRQRNEHAKEILALLDAALGAELNAEEVLRGINLLAYASFEVGTDEHRERLSAVIRKVAPLGRYTADAYLDLADAALAKGELLVALEHCKNAEKAAGDGESSAFYRTARAFRPLLDGRASPARSKWAKREVLDVVVLARDLPGFAAAISQWNEKQYFPVLFADDLYAPKFVAAFKPAQVVLLPETKDAAPQLTPGALRRAVQASFSTKADKRQLPANVSDVDLLIGLDAIGGGGKSNGIVIADETSGEIAGGIALAAGRFQGLEFIPPPQIDNGKGGERAATPNDQLPRAAALQFSQQINAALTRWQLPQDDMLAHITLAGNYPYRCLGKQDNFGGTHALDDLIGRDEDFIRIAAVGRLCGDQARSAYQAACSLFLQPERALLFNNYDTNPKTIWGQYRMDFAEKELSALQPRHLRDAAAHIGSFRENAAPWNRHGLMFINSSGGSNGWSVRDGGGTSDDFPIGVPAALHVTHSFSAANVYDPDTLAGRAVWGGAFFYFGSASEPYVNSFQPPSNYAPRLALGAPFASVFRQRVGQQFWQPWRLMIVGDPQYCLLKEAPKRKAYERKGFLVGEGEREIKSSTVACFLQMPKEKPVQTAWLSALKEARWANDHSIAIQLADMSEGMSLDGPSLALVLEEFLLAGRHDDVLQRWSKANDDARKHYAARVYARYTAAHLMDKALLANDSAALLKHFDALLTAAPAQNFVERWIDKAEALAKKTNAAAKFDEWHAQQLRDGAPFKHIFAERQKRAQEKK